MSPALGPDDPTCPLCGELVIPQPTDTEGRDPGYPSVELVDPRTGEPHRCRQGVEP